jgi:hypothetical protein
MFTSFTNVEHRPKRKSQKNLCVDAWAVDKSWSAEDLKSEAAKLFPKVLGIDSPELKP